MNKNSSPILANAQLNIITGGKVDKNSIAINRLTTLLRDFGAEDDQVINLLRTIYKSDHTVTVIAEVLKALILIKVKCKDRKELIYRWLFTQNKAFEDTPFNLLHTQEGRQSIIEYLELKHIVQLNLGKTS